MQYRNSNTEQQKKITAAAAVAVTDAHTRTDKKTTAYTASSKPGTSDRQNARIVPRHTRPPPP